MDPTERIQQLEKQVRELTDLVQRISPESASQEPPSRKMRRRNKQHPARQMLKDDMRRNVDKVLGGEQGETLETRIGGIWLSRIAMVLLMTVAVLGARVTIYTDIFGPAQKLAITFAASVIAITYGVVWWRRENIFPETVLGAGLAGLYFTVYAAFFVQGMQIFANGLLAACLLTVGLLVLLAILHIRHSQATAGIALFLVYYTVVASAMSGDRLDNVVYALACSAAVAIAAMLFHILHRWLLFSWATLIATYATYFFYFSGKPIALQMSELEYFWLSNGFLALCYVVFSIGCIFDARKTGEYRHTVAQICGVNSAIFFTFTWFAIRDVYLAQEWIFRLGFTAALLFFALLAQFTGPRNNYLFQIFIAKTIVMFTLALQAYFSGAQLMVAMSLECLGLAFSYKRSGIVTFKVMGLCMLLITFIGCLFHIKAAGQTQLWAITVPSNWFCCAGSAGTFLLVASFYEQFIQRVRPEQRIVKSQWFLADTWLDLRSGTAALLYAAAAALILLTITIIDLGTQPQLPYLLAAEAVTLGLIGFLLRTPQIQIAGVLLLVGCHVCYYAFLIIGLHGFENQPAFAPYTILVALMTYLGAYFWERYLTRVRGGRPWEHHTVSAVPYLAATGMLATLIIRTLTDMDVTLAEQALGIVLLLAGAISGYPGIKASGLVAFGIAGGLFCHDLLAGEEELLTLPYFMVQFVLFLLAFVIAERLFVVLQRQERQPSRMENCIRITLIAFAMTVGAIVFRLYASTEYLTIYWVALAVSAAALGALFGESRYRWAAIIMFGITIIRAFQVDLRRLPPVYSFISFAVLTAAALIVTWSYSRYRQRIIKQARPDAPKDHAPEG